MKGMEYGHEKHPGLKSQVHSKEDGDGARG